jgi:hypothetical protein
MDPQFIALAREQVKGTPFLPRDPLLPALYGKGPPLKLSDGTRLNNMATRIDISDLFDCLYWKPGGIMLRGKDPDYWNGLDVGTDGQGLQVVDGMPAWVDPVGTGFDDQSILLRQDDAWEEFKKGTASQVLSMSNDGSHLEWKDGVPSSAGGTLVMNTSSGNSTDGYALKGNYFGFMLPCTVNAMIFGLQKTSTMTYDVALYSCDSSGKILTVERRWTPSWATDTNFRDHIAICNPPLTLNANVRYCAALIRTDGTGTTGAQAINGGPWGTQFPRTFGPTYCVLANNNPTVGTTIPIPGAGDPFHFGLLVSFPNTDN